MTFREENFIFDFQNPYIAKKKSFTIDEYVPFHYNDNIEILFSENVNGNIMIADHNYKFCNNTIIVIPPNVIHGTKIKKCDGYLWVIQISFEAISHYINLKNIINYEKYEIEDIPILNKDFNNLELIIKKIESNHLTLFELINYFLIIFKTLLKNAKDNKIINKFKGNNLKKLIDWTENNWNRKINIIEAAEILSFSKYYFCNFFKSYTGITYLTYLNQVRIHNAKKFLRDNKNVSETCYACGFENVSYFIQLFKKITGYTPKKYISKIF